MRGERTGDSWRVITDSEFFNDRIAQFGDEVSMGGLAKVADGQRTVTTAYVVERGLVREGAYWFDNASGDVVQHEQLAEPDDVELFRRAFSMVPQANADCGQLAQLWGPTTLGDVEVLCRPEPTPTVIPNPSPPASVTPTPSETSPPTPAPSDTASPPPTATPSPPSSATPTPEPLTLYLPLLLRESCDAEHKRSDIALVLDTSSSMIGPKIADAKAAALLFVGMVDLAPSRSQVAIVRYDREAEVVRELTRSRALIEAAIRGLQVRSGTHIDKGLRAALGELQSPRHEDLNMPVMILLTDGLQTGTPGEELRAAEEVRDAGIRLYTIGLGSDIDETALTTMAGDDSRYYRAPDSADLAAIYEEIAQDLRCPGKRLWGGRSTRELGRLASMHGSGQARPRRSAVTPSPLLLL